MRINPMVWALALTGLLSIPAKSIAGDGDGKVLFVSTRDGNAQIFVMNGDGSGQKPLTLGPAENTEPAWSPDGKRIAFTSYRDGNAEIYVMNADGSHPQRLTDNRRADNTPAWTADGRIVFRSLRDRNANLFIMDADGRNLARLTSDQLDKGPPLPSPDGKQVAFFSFSPNDRQDIQVVDVAGSAQRNLTAEQPKDKKLGAAWSVDGNKISYAESRGYALNLRLVDLQSGRVDKLTEGGSAVFANAVWSPDGQRIAYVSSPEGNADRARGDIYVMNADGSCARNLTANPAEDNYPAWSTDGSRIYFVSLRDGNAQIYAVSVDGTQQARLTQNLGHDVMLRPHYLPATKPVSGGPGLVVASNSNPSVHIKE
ncbi:MAG: PD40 domain-containing protein [Candidatus Accumulibacter sp.]|uniref:SMP-30/gluconolactonase/LRE family protein n=1 Tax=Accumulibacter sp. TaxID=2053492 RepID=UPI001A387EF9|nr:SMP-30/gluconolactonase/LRE family protein [Accumulibacter sp.]MBL8393135.1 PD40 domain-containing protein [Accumulibacter sp.]